MHTPVASALDLSSMQVFSSCFPLCGRVSASRCPTLLLFPSILSIDCTYEDWEDAFARYVGKSTGICVPGNDSDNPRDVAAKSLVTKGNKVRGEIPGQGSMISFAKAFTPSSDCYQLDTPLSPPSVSFDLRFPFLLQQTLPHFPFLTLATGGKLLDSLRFIDGFSLIGQIVSITGPVNGDTRLSKRSISLSQWTLSIVSCLSNFIALRFLSTALQSAKRRYPFLAMTRLTNTRSLSVHGDRDLEPPFLTPFSA